MAREPFLPSPGWSLAAWALAPTSGAERVSSHPYSSSTFCLSCLNPGDCPFSSSSPDFLPRLPQSSPTSFLSLLICLPPLCFLALPWHMPFSLPGMSPPCLHTDSHFWAPVKPSSTLACFMPARLCPSLSSVMYPFTLGITEAENCFRLRKNK